MEEIIKNLEQSIKETMERMNAETNPTKRTEYSRQIAELNKSLASAQMAYNEPKRIELERHEASTKNICNWVQLALTAVGVLGGLGVSVWSAHKVIEIKTMNQQNFGDDSDIMSNN